MEVNPFTIERLNVQFRASQMQKDELRGARFEKVG
jgi:hypothetical protein